MKANIPPPAKRTVERTALRGRTWCWLALTAALGLGQGSLRADQTIEGNLTVTQGLLIQQDTNLYGATTFGRLVENPQMEGFRVSTQQDSWTSTYTNVLSPGYWVYRTVTVEDYGLVDNGYWSPICGWVTVNDYFPATFDADGNMLTPESWGSHQESQQGGFHKGTRPDGTVDPGS